MFPFKPRLRVLSAVAIQFAFVGFSVAMTGADQAAMTVKSMTDDQLLSYYRSHSARMPASLPPGLPAPTTAPAAKRAAAPNPLPGRMVFPGEWEEVQAVFIAWPYITLDSNGKSNMALQGDELFDGLGLYNSGTTTRLGKVVTQPDVNASSSMARIQMRLAKCIDDNAEVWINIYHASDSAAIRSYLRSNGVTLNRCRFFVNPGNSFWYRDCGPIGFYFGDQDSVGFIDFEYYNGRPLDDDLPIKLGAEAGFRVFTNQIDYEGGNVLLDSRGALFTSDAVYAENADTLGKPVYNPATNWYTQAKKIALSHQQVVDSLKHLLSLRSATVLPALQYDGGTGHIDLYADMWDENRFVFSKMPAQLSSLTDYGISNSNITTIMAAIRSDSTKYRNSFLPFPKRDDGTWYTSNRDYEKYTRTYSNHVFVNKTIIQPVFKSTGVDLDSIKAKYPGYTIDTIDVTAFDGLGGAIHCITKQIPAANPLRIVHEPLDTAAGYETSYQIRAMMYNRSGIASAVCKYRYKGAASWDSAAFSKADDTTFTSAIPNARPTGTIEYYLAATSNNGKSMTKPITAPAGFYSFDFSNSIVAVAPVAATAAGTRLPLSEARITKSGLVMRSPGREYTVAVFDVAGKAILSAQCSAKGFVDRFAWGNGKACRGAFLLALKSEKQTVACRRVTALP